MPDFTYQQRSIHYLDVGQGPALILLHGLGSCANDWQPQIEVLALHNRVIAPDFRGHGKSSIAHSPFSIKELAEDIKVLSEHLQLSQYQVVGFSLGGMVAFELALLSPREIEAMVIINSGPAVMSRSWSLRLQLHIRMMVIRILGMRRLGQIIAKKLFVKDQHQHLIQRFATQMALTHASSYRYTLRAISNFSVLEQIGRINMPVLVISADHDYTSVEFKRDYVRLLPHATLLVIADSRHATPMDQADILNQHLCDFLHNKNSTNTTVSF